MIRNDSKKPGKTQRPDKLRFPDPPCTPKPPKTPPPPTPPGGGDHTWPNPFRNPLKKGW